MATPRRVPEWAGIPIGICSAPALIPMQLRRVWIPNLFSTRHQANPFLVARNVVVGESLDFLGPLVTIKGIDQLF